MEIRFQNSPKEVAAMNTAEIRSNFLLESLMVDDRLKLVYSHYDRMIVGAARPVKEAISLATVEELKAAFFLERREMGIINVGATGKVIADGVEYVMEKLSCVYLGKGTKEVSFQSENSTEPALFFILSCPAHIACPNKLMSKVEADPVELGAVNTSNVRILYKYIHPAGIQSCQLVMGLTVLQDGSVWNSVPPHTHTRRTEVYFYFDLPEGQRVFHFMGQPAETRHIVVDNHQAIISPPWSVHFGSGSSNYGFIWGMIGENMAFADMDQVAIAELK